MSKEEEKRVEDKVEEKIGKKDFFLIDFYQFSCSSSDIIL